MHLISLISCISQSHFSILPRDWFRQRHASTNQDDGVKVCTHLLDGPIEHPVDTHHCFALPRVCMCARTCVRDVCQPYRQGRRGTTGQGKSRACRRRRGRTCLIFTVTMAPAPTKASSWMQTLPSTFAPAPILTRFPILGCLSKASPLPVS